MSDREAFEAAFPQLDTRREHRGEQYDDATTEFTWRAWTAALTHARQTPDPSAARIAEALEWRGLSDATPCKECGGAGIKCYGSTATWRGGIGGQALTNDVCNKCWGSGNADKAWPSHRALAPTATPPGEARDGG